MRVLSAGDDRKRGEADMVGAVTAKMKILYIVRILEEETDEEHPVTIQDIIAKLDGYGISAERKSIYNDLEQLRLSGVDIIREHRDRNYYYYLGSRPFELAELKLLVDCVQSARFITETKSNILIHKLEGLVSRFQASRLQRQVFVTGRVKSDNEQILYNIDAIHSAISGNSQISFKYFNWNSKKKRELRHGGKSYEMSPWALTLTDENYYLVAYDPATDLIKYFRVDKMLDITATGQKRDGLKKFRSFDIADYAAKRFGMFDGEEKRVKLRCRNEYAGVIIDRFGRKVSLIPEDADHFSVNVTVAVSPQFYGWLFAMADGIEVTGPEEITAEMAHLLQQTADKYSR